MIDLRHFVIGNRAMEDFLKALHEVVAERDGKKAEEHRRRAHDLLDLYLDSASLLARSVDG